MSEYMIEYGIYQDDRKVGTTERVIFASDQEEAQDIAEENARDIEMNLKSRNGKSDWWADAESVYPIGD